MLKHQSKLFFLCLVLCTVDVNALSVRYFESVTNGTEHHNEPRTPYNEDNDGVLYEIRTTPVRDSVITSVTTSYRFTSGDFINSHYDHTKFINFSGEACTSNIIRYCWAFGVGGFDGYENTPDMLEGYALVPMADHSIQIHAKGFEAIYRQYWLMTAVSSDYWGIGYAFKF